METAKREIVHSVIEKVRRELIQQGKMYNSMEFSLVRNTCMVLVYDLWRKGVVSKDR